MEMKGKSSLSKKEESSSSKKRTMSRTTSEESRTFHQNGHQTVSYTHKDGISETSVKKSCYTKSRRSYEVKTQSITIDCEEVEKTCHKERDKESSSSRQILESSYKPSSCSPTDQDLEFYPVDDYSTSPSTFTAWDAFMSGNQAFFREPCVPDYSCSVDFSYMDVIPEEDASVMESDTDDTGSSVSTVIDKFSRTSTANSSFSERIKTKEDAALVTFDLEQVLSPFEQLEKELDEGNSELMPHALNGDQEMKENHYVEVQINTGGLDTFSLKSSQFSECNEDTENHIQEYYVNGGVGVNCGNEVQSKPRAPISNGLSKSSQENTTPLVPLRTKLQNNSKENGADRGTISKDKREENVSQPIPPPIVPRKKESYPTPVVPPRMSKHSPARRTRSDPGSSDNQTPSRIPRPIFVTRSSTFTEKNGVSSPTTPKIGSIPRINKTTSIKTSPPKKVKFSGSGKVGEEQHSDKSNGIQKVSRGYAEQISDRVSIDDTDSSSSTEASHADEQEKEVESENSTLDAGAHSEKSAVPSLTAVQSEKEILRESIEMVELTPNNNDRLLNSSAWQQEANTKNSSFDANSMDTTSSTISDVISDHRKEALSLKEVNIMTPNLSNGLHVQEQKDLVGQNPTQFHAGNFPKNEVIKSFDDERITSCALISSMEMYDFPLSGDMAQSEKLTEDTSNADEVHLRPIADILQALDNLCSAPSSRDIEIDVKWTPVEQSLTNIAERILAPGLTSPEGSLQKDANESFVECSSPKGYFPHDEHGDCIVSDEETRTSSILNLQAENKPQQPTPPEVSESLTARDWETSKSNKEKALGPGAPAVSSVGPNALHQQVLQAPEGSHALPTKGHCHQDSSALPHTNPKTSEMDMLNKLEKSPLPLEEHIVNSNARQPPDGHEYPNSYQDSFQSTSNLFESEDSLSAKHSLGCDDSGVFLEDIPYTPDFGDNSQLSESNHQAVSGSPPLFVRTLKSDLTLRRPCSPDMRQYSIEAHNGQDSDAEKSDDMGLASSSVDSADDLDIDSVPIVLQAPKSETPAYTKQRPPPVPIRKSLLHEKSTRTGECEAPKNHSSPVVCREEEPVKTILNKSYDDVCGVNKDNSFQSFKWKSEECLKSDVGSRWSNRKNEKSISVKDRIAMFSEMESSSSVVKKEPPLQRFASEICVKHALSVEDIDKNANFISTQQHLSSKAPNSSNLNRDNKWFSMQSISSASSSPMPNVESLKPNTEKVSKNVKSPYSIPSSISPSSCLSNNSGSMNALKIETESYKGLEKPIISSYPQTQLTNNKRYNYGLYSLKPLKPPEELAKKSGSLLSIIDTKKQLPKLKGLVIPDKPPQASNSKALPTIVSNDSVILPLKSEAHLDSSPDKEPWKKSPFSILSTMSLPRNRADMKSKVESYPERDSLVVKLIDPPWKTSNVNNNNTLPKYSPAFKRRTLELPHVVGSSLSPTPPSSITSPLSPPPSSPSSVCSSNASSSSLATKQQNIFQFSLSHSKPVTPVLPEKPIMSPPSLPSDIEYEGDNSEDSSTSASPMLSGHEKGREASEKQLYSSSATFYSESSRYQKPSSTEEMTSSILFPGYINGSFIQVPQNSRREASTGINKSEITLQNNVSSPNGVELGSVNDVPQSKFVSTVDSEVKEKRECQFNKTCREVVSSEISQNCIPNGSNFSNISVAHPNPENIYHVSRKEAGDSSGNRNGFAEAKQEVLNGKFRAQPLKFSEVTAGHKNGDFPSMSSLDYKDKPDNRNRYIEAKNSYPTSPLDLQNGDSFCDSKTDNGVRMGNGSVVDKYSWSQSDLTPFIKRTSGESEDDDNQSSLSQRTEDSRNTTDEYLSDTTVDSVDKSVDPDLKPRRLSQQKTVLRAAMDSTDSVQKFRALAEKWEQRAEPASDAKSPTPPILQSAHSASRRDSRSMPLSNNSPPVLGSSILSNNNNGSSSLKLPPSLLPRYPNSELPLEKKGSSAASMAQKTIRESRPCLLRSTSLVEDKDTLDAAWKENSRPYPRQHNTNIQDEIANLTWSETSHSSNKTAVGNEEKGLNFIRNDLSGNYHKNISKEEGNGIISKNHTLPSCTKRVISNDDDSWKKKSPTSNKNNRANDREEFNSGWNRSSSNNVIKPGARECTDILDYKKSGIRDGANGFANSRNLSRSQVLHSSGTNGIKLGTSSFFPGNKSISVSDIRKAFESQAQSEAFDIAPKPVPRRIASEDDVLSSNVPPKRHPVPSDHQRISSFDSTTSEPDILLNTGDGRYGSAGSLPSITRDSYGSVTSLSSTTSIISPQELQQLIDEANQSLEETGTLFHEILVVVLHREIPGGSIGITLAGGADYEIKEITVHKVISGSLADRDGRIRKGDRVISINGRNLKGISHRDALEILKAPRPEVVLVISRERLDGSPTRGASVQQQNSREGRRKGTMTRKPSEDVTCSQTFDTEDSNNHLIEVGLVKDGTGLGFSIEGGKDSPLGDKPLIIKRIFKGGIADKEGHLEVGDEIISVNSQPVTNMTRTEAWNFLKKLPVGAIVLKARKALFPAPS